MKPQKGVFINYQIAEAITEIISNEEIDLSTENGLKKAQNILDKLKERWKDDEIPGYGQKIGTKLTGMEDITIEDILQTMNELKQYDVISCENAANMQYCMIRNENGDIDFDFSALEKIIALADLTGKKVIIDSAIAFGDNFPENMAKMNQAEIKLACETYVQKLLTSRFGDSKFGDYIERIDVLNSVFQRNNVFNKQKSKTSEQFWIDAFGDNYGAELLNLVHSNLGDYQDEIQLCWNEFHLTYRNEFPQDEKAENSNIFYQKRFEAFIKLLTETKDLKLDVIGIQDRFRSDASIGHILDKLNQLKNLCQEKGLKMAITEQGCALSGNDIKLLNSTENASDYENLINDINTRIQKIVTAIDEFAQNNPETVISEEGRLSDKFDCNNRDAKANGHDISTTGKQRLPESSITLQDIGKETAKSFQKNPGKAMKTIDDLENGVKNEKQVKETQTQGERV